MVTCIVTYTGIKMVRGGWMDRCSTHQETATIDVEPEFPLTAIVDQIQTDLDEIRIRKLEFIYD